MKIKGIKGFFALAAAVILLFAMFVAGCSNGSAESSYKWIVKTIKENYYEDISDEDLLKYSMSGGVESLLDIYSEYYTAEEYEEVLSSNAGNKVGVGVSYTFVEGKGILLNLVMGNSPAYICGLRAGLYLTSGTDKSGNTVEFTNIDVFGELVDSFGKGEQMRFTASDGNTYEVAKAEYTASYTALYTNETSWRFEGITEGDHLPLKEDRGQRLDYLPDGVGYLTLSQFYGDAPWEFGQLVTKFNAAGCKSLILDLRNNGGGYVHVMQAIANYFIAGIEDAGKTTMYAEYKSGKKEYYGVYVSEENKDVISPQTSVYVLANDGTASASEALIGVLISYGVTDYSHIYLSDYSQEYVGWVEDSGGEVKSGRTYGKGIMQTTFTNFSTGEALKLTTAKIYWPNGKCIHGVGITAADGCKTVAAEWSVTYEDAELQLAVADMFRQSSNGNAA